MLSLRVSILNVAIEGFLAPHPAGRVPPASSGLSSKAPRRMSAVVFVRKSVPEIQYLKSSITDEQRREYGHLVEATVGQIQSRQFPAHSGIRFPQNGCVSCSHLGLCLDRPEIVAANLIRKPGASDLDWLDELVD